MQRVISSSSVDRWLLQKILSVAGRPAVRLRLGNGDTVSCPGAEASGTLIIRNRRALLKLIRNLETGFGDCYARGLIEVEGSLVDLLDAAYRSWPARRRRWFSALVSGWMERLGANSPQRSRKNVHHHYDLKTDFYKLWLDSQLVYTCAYFPSESTSLEDAQTAKMDYVCRKVGLERGETVVEAGCGWGALALHMARHYGVRVKAFNLSHEQTVFARQRARQEGLGERVEFIEDDYRNISGQFDAFISVGMLEHVGVSHYADLGRVIHRAMGSSGRGLLHFIGRNRPAPLSAWIRERIFPGAYAPTLKEAMQVLEPWNFSVCDVENLRMHYARTLEHWLDRFERSSRQLTSMFDSEFVRAWRLYLAGSLVGFRTGSLQLFQVTFAGPQCDRIPWTRAHLYAAAGPQSQESKWIHTMFSS